jgi:hypothetical protein
MFNLAAPPSLSEGLQAGTKPPVSHIIHHMGEEGGLKRRKLKLILNFPLISNHEYVEESKILTESGSPIWIVGLY